MTKYSWPANLLEENGKWIVSLVDFPEAAGTAGSMQEAVLLGQSALCGAVQDRINTQKFIPAPSNLLPDQIPIVVDSFVSEQLDRLIEANEQTQLRHQSEKERNARERRAAYLSEHRSATDRTERNQTLADEAAIKFAAIGINTTYILNGGALLVIPAILQFAENGIGERSHLVLAVVLFVLGILLAVVANLTAYHSVMKAGLAHGNVLSASALEVSTAFYPPEDSTENHTSIAYFRSNSKDEFSKAQRAAKFGLASFILSTVVFLFGVAVIIFSIANAPAISIDQVIGPSNSFEVVPN